MAGILSDQGGARALLMLSENEKIDLLATEQVIVEIERNIARKAPKLLPFAREMILRAKISILHDPEVACVKEYIGWISHTADLPILVSAMNAEVGFLVTLNSKHFIDDPDVARRSGLLIGTPGDALKWLCNKLITT
jgi:predicted nucleic acid-binding protein